MEESKANSGATALVTGGAGFIGSHVARRLVERGLSVVVLDDLSGGFAEQSPTGADFIEGSVLDRPLVERLFAEHSFDYVFHLAAYAAEGLSPFIRCFNYQNNLIGSVEIINMAVKHEVKRFVFTSSIAVYGAGQLPMTESMTPAPEDPYGISKYAVELDLACARTTFGLPYTVFRPHNVYGEHQNIGDRYRNVVGIFMNQVMQGEPLTIFGDGEQTRGFSYIDDVAAPIVDCLDLPDTIGETFNVGADTPISVNMLAEAVMEAMGSRVETTHLPARNEVVHAYSAHEKIAHFFPDLDTPHPLESGLLRMALWARAHGPRKTRVFPEMELLQNMPPSWRRELDLA